MEVKYDKNAILDYISGFRHVQDLMKRDMDESINKYTACMQEYSRLATECEEESKRAYNRMMAAEREIQIADMMMEQARASASDSDDENSQPDYAMMDRAQSMKRQAEAELGAAQADYNRAQENIGKLNAAIEKYGPSLEAEARVVNDTFSECSLIGDKAGEALEQYIGVMDKAHAALYEGAAPQGGAVGAGTSSASGPSSADCIGSAATAAGTVAAAGAVAYMIAGQKREFEHSKTGLNRAYKAALKSNDRAAADQILEDFNNFGNAPVPDASLLYKSKLTDIDAYIDNYRDALLARGIPDGEWLRSTLASHKVRMKEQAGYEVDSITGYASDRINNPNAYQYPADDKMTEFYDNLANEYYEYIKTHNDPVHGSNMVDTFRYDDSSSKKPGQQAAEMQKFTGKPLVVKEDEFEEYASKSGMVGFRTFSSGIDVVTKEEQGSEHFAQQLKTGQFYRLNGNGRQAYGEGTYFAVNHGSVKGTFPKTDLIDVAFEDSRYYGKGNDVSTVKMTVRNDMIIKSYEEVFEEFVKLDKSQQARFGGRGRDGIAAYAVSKGIDALIHEYWDLDYLIVYNRTKLIVSEKNI